MGCKPPYRPQTQQKGSETVNWIDSEARKNYSRTVPVEISHPDADRPLSGFAILDDQSTMTMLDKSAIEFMGLPYTSMETDTLSTTTIQGTSAPKKCLSVKGLRVAPINEAWNKIDLPSTYLHKSPNLRHEIPTQDQVAKMPGFEHLADEFLPNLKGLKTIMLIGRDCILAQRQRQFTNNQNKHQIAAETPLGWCIMGRSPPNPSQRFSKFQIPFQIINSNSCSVFKT